MLDETSLMIFAVFTEAIVVEAILVPTAYRAFKMRAVLRNKFSRSQALWIGVVAIFMMPVLWATFPYSNPLANIVFGIAYLWAVPIVLVAWVDGAVRAARRSDPLYRDTLAWTKIRIILWAVTFAAAAINFGLFILEAFAGVPPLAISAVLVFAPLLPPMLAGAPALLLVARRTRSAIRRSNAKWFALYYVFQLASVSTSVVTIAGSSNYNSSDFWGFLAFKGIYAIGWNAVEIFFLISAYCLYRYARSLAELNRLPLRDEDERPDVEANE